MADEVQAVTDTQDTTESAPLSPFDFLKQFSGAPSQEKINSFKQQAPGGRIKLITSSDGKRVYILRAISAFELQNLQESPIFKTVAPEKYALTLKTELAAKCILWTNATPTGKMDNMELKTSGAGLVDTLHEVISELSDYMEAPQIARYSADL